MSHIVAVNLSLLWSEGEAVALHDREGRLKVDVAVVWRGHFAYLLERRRLGQLGEGAEQLLKACWGDELKARGGLIAGIPEGVPLPSRLEQQVTRLRDHLRTFDDRTDAAGEDEGVLVLVVVAVHRRGERLRCEQVLYEGEAAVCVSTVDHEAFQHTVEPGLGYVLSGG